MCSSVKRIISRVKQFRLTVLIQQPVKLTCGFQLHEVVVSAYKPTVNEDLRDGVST